MKEPETDAEVLAWAAKLTTEAICRAAEAKLAGGGFEETLAAASLGLGRTVVKHYDANDLREIGCVNGVPRALWHWVYRDRRDPKTAIILSWRMRLRLQTDGFVSIQAFTNEGLD